MSGDIEVYKKKGLTEIEAKALKDWEEQGKPGLSKFRAERFGQIYILGYSCQDIQKWFSDYPIQILLWARIHYGWDDLRQQYARSMQANAIQAALTVQSESIRLVADLAAATHLKWRTELMEYLASPEKTKAPEFLPKTFNQYCDLMEQLIHMTTPLPGPGGEPPKPLVNINIGNNVKDIELPRITPKAVEKALLDEMEARGGNKLS